MRDGDAMACEQPPRGVREPRRSPAICDDGRCYPHGDDPRGPAERGHCQGDAGGGAARAQGEDDGVRGLGRLGGELESGEHMSRHRSRVRATAGDPAPRPERRGTPPGAQHGEGEGGRAPRAYDERRPAGARRRDGAARDGVGLPELGEYGLVAECRRVDRGAKAVRGARPARRDEDRSPRHAGQQELEPPYLVPAARCRRPVFALHVEGGHAQGAREGRRRLERRWPRAQATRHQRRTYLFTQQRRIRHLNPDPEDADAGCHGLHPPRRARRPQVRGRPARWPAPFPTTGRRLLQDAGQGAGGDRRGPGRAQQARVSYIDTPAALADAVATLRREPLVAADTEAASFHRYHDRIFLVQLASPSLTAIIDPLAIADLSPVRGLLDHPKAEKIFHDADYDLRILDRDYGFRAHRLFDTRIAAQLAGEPAVGRRGLPDKYVGVKLAKEHQKADWSRRPLPPAMLGYAAADTQHLPALREALRSHLAALQRLAWAEEEFTRLEDLRWTATPDGGGPDAFLRVKGAKALPPRQLAALRELYRWREGVAAEQDRATFRIIGNDALLAVARALPQSAAELARVGQLPGALAGRHGPALLDAVRRALALGEADLPRVERTPRPPRDTSVEARVERRSAARTRAAPELGLEPGVLCGRSTLEAVARALPLPNDRAGLARIGELRRWQIDALGDALLAAFG